MSLTTRPLARRQLPLLLLAACSTAPQAPEAALFDDARFRPATLRTDRAQVFELSAAMRSFLQRDMASSLRLNGPRRGLFLALRDHGYLQLDYDASVTRNAAEAFEARAGNCLSLVVMTAAFAHELDIRVGYQSVQIDEVWSRSSNFVLLSGHVNLTLAPGMREIGSSHSSGGTMVIDFVPVDEDARVRAQNLSEDTIVAMFMNNRAVERMEQGDHDNAYHLLKGAIRADPGYLNAYNTLAVLYRRLGVNELAERSLRFVMRHDPRNVQALSNLVLVLKAQERKVEAQAAEVELQRLQPRTPFADYERGLAAAKRGDWLAARRYFERELSQVPHFHELHFWLARTYYELGERELSAKHMKEAHDQALTLESRQRYAYKLEVLRRPRPQPTLRGGE
ncbi:tetratricopeptide repeat protein [Inhella sp.]|uniref:tetratricopeptide repeat protein n=1 Tax=Inhella sp. TaxID=1921806 RepID=UPI0035AF0863